MTASAIYVGSVSHRRRDAVGHGFRHPVGMLYVDVDELPAVLEHPPLWSATRRAPGRLCRRDLLGDPAVPLAQAVRDEVERQGAQRPQGPIRLLTMPRTFGRCFNPVTLYYCFDGAGERVERVVAEITNTPWGERHRYVLSPQGSAVLEARHEKAFHVSPFQPPRLTYRWRITAPAERLTVHVTLSGERPLFDATLSLQRRPLDRRGLALLLARWPLAASRTLTFIYGHAALLALRGAPHFRHPSGGSIA